MRQRRGKQLGQWGERVACWYLSQKKFYTILETGYQTRFGEIDIIAQDTFGQFVFVEVKTRSFYSGILPEDGLSKKKIHNIRQCILSYISKKMIYNSRIDLLAIECGNQVDKITIRHHVAVSDIWAHKSDIF